VFRGPRDVAIDSQGRVIVTDSDNSRVQVFRRGGRFLAQWSGKTIAPAGFDPIGVAVDASDHVYIADADNDRIEVFRTV
jgi:DNA-binding beta-propeller fold protein YncE